MAVYEMCSCYKCHVVDDILKSKQVWQDYSSDLQLTNSYFRLMRSWSWRMQYEQYGVHPSDNWLSDYCINLQLVFVMLHRCLYAQIYLIAFASKIRTGNVESFIIRCQAHSFRFSSCNSRQVKEKDGKGSNWGVTNYSIVKVIHNAFFNSHSLELESAWTGAEMFRCTYHHFARIEVLREENSRVSQRDQWKLNNKKLASLLHIILGILDDQLYTLNQMTYTWRF